MRTRLSNLINCQFLEPLHVGHSAAPSLVPNAQVPKGCGWGVAGPPGLKRSISFQASATEKVPSPPPLFMSGLAGSHQLGGLTPPSLWSPGRGGWRALLRKFLQAVSMGHTQRVASAFFSLLQGHSPLRTFSLFLIFLLWSLNNHPSPVGSPFCPRWENLRACIWHPLSLGFIFKGTTGHPSKNGGGSE